jgi:hypothetical protein
MGQCVDIGPLCGCSSFAKRMNRVLLRAPREDPGRIMDTQEVENTWHPMGVHYEHWSVSLMLTIPGTVHPARSGAHRESAVPKS